MGETGDSEEPKPLRPETTPIGERSHRWHWFTGRANAILDESRTVLTATMSPVERAETLAEITRLQDRLDAMAATLVGDDPTVIDELRQRTLVTGRTRRRISKRARRLAAHAEVATALAGGEIHTDQAEVIAHVVDKLPAEVQHLTAEATGVMLELALTHDADELKAMGNHLIHVVAPDLADELLARELEREEREARRSAYVKTWRDGQGSTYGKFKLPDLHGHLLQTLLHAMANPGRPDPIEREDGRAERQTPEVLGQAFCELLEKINPTDLPQTGGTPVTVLVTMTLATLRGGLKAAGILGTDLPLSASEARRLATRHRIVPVVLGSKSEILDLGRTKRLHTRAQRIAMALRQGGLCNRAGCDVPTAWCEANHRTTDWAYGGHTDHHHGKNFPRRT